MDTHWRSPARHFPDGPSVKVAQPGLEKGRQSKEFTCLISLVSGKTQSAGPISIRVDEQCISLKVPAWIRSALAPAVAIQTAAGADEVGAPRS